MPSTKCSPSLSQSIEILKNLHFFNFPFSLLNSYSAGSFDVHSTRCSFYLSLIKPYLTRNPEKPPLQSLFPILRRVKTQNHAKQEITLCRSAIPDVSTKTNPLHLLINRRKAKDGETYGFYNNSNGEWY